MGLSCDKAQNGGRDLQGFNRHIYHLVVVLFGVFALLVCSGLTLEAATTHKNVITIVSPPDNVWVTEKSLFLAGTVTGLPLSSLTISGVKNKAAKNKVGVQNGAFGVKIFLKEGKNKITLTHDSSRKTVTVYYVAAKNAQKGRTVPKSAKHFYVHSNPVTLDCKECHKLRRGKYNFKRIIPARSTCTTKCHTDIGKSAHVHGPVGAGICISCHNPHGSYQPMAIERTGQELCLVCHEAKRAEFSAAVVHAPVKDGCIDCHNPHESPMRFQLRGTGTSVSSLCFNCHEAEMFTKNHRHGPVGSGDCIACHRPHAGKFKNLLIASPEKGELCFQCHKDRKQEFTMKFVHNPVEENCNKCHDPHSSDFRFQLHDEGSSLCFDCHKEQNPELFKTIKNATHQHKPVKDGDCVACHRPHSSNNQALLRKNTEKLCFSCHLELADHVAESKYRHGPVQTGDCLACHDVHGSDFSNILTKYFPQEFYKEYQPGNYDLCFGCHNKDIAKKKFTKTLTNFRDGEYNLHYFHVNMKKGRNCVACHDPHASNQAKHIRTEVPFGRWSYPISITKTKTGATCVVGCHAPKTYDRNRPKIKPSR